MSAHIDRGMVGSEHTREVDVQASPKNARKENWAACDQLTNSKMAAIRERLENPVYPTKSRTPFVVTAISCPHRHKTIG